MVRASLRPRSRIHLSAAMDAAGLDTVSLADRAGVSKQYISLLVRGERGCRPRVAEAIAKALNLPTPELFISSRLFVETNNTETDMPTLATATEDPWLYFDDVAALAEVSPDTLRYWRHTGRGPEFKKFGRRLRIRRSAAQRWIEKFGT